MLAELSSQLLCGHPGLRFHVAFSGPPMCHHGSAGLDLLEQPQTDETM